MDDDEGEALPPVQFDPFLLVVAAASITQDTVHAVATAADLLFTAVGSHANWRVDRRRFATQTALDIETITSKECR